MLTFRAMLSTPLSLFLDAEPSRAPDFRRLGEHLPFEWIEQAVSYSGKASIRHRRLPAKQVVWLVIALALFRHQSISEVVDNLDLAMPDASETFVTKSAVTQARERLGIEPLKWLFQTSARAWSSDTAEQYRFRGLNLLAVDGTTLRTPDSPENRAHFGAQKYKKNTVASYPQVRGVTVTSVPTHLVVDARFGPYKTSEVEHAMALIPGIADDTLTVFDKAFLSADILIGLSTHGKNRHFLIPAKSNTKWTVLEGNDNDALVRMEVSAHARKLNPSLPKYWQARAIRTIDAAGHVSTLLTSLTDRQQFPAAELVACYARRWQVETSYLEIKHSMMGTKHTLRSRTTQGIEQEIWGLLIAYNLLRAEIAEAALDANCEPTDISFIRAFHTFQYELHWLAITRAQGKMPALLQRLRSGLVLLHDPPRPNRKFDRTVKSKPQRYPYKTTKANKMEKTNA